MTDKELELKLKATGGDQAAKEVGKVSAANEELSDSAKGVSEEVDSAVAQLDALAAAAQDLGPNSSITDKRRALIALEQALEDAADEAARFGDDAAEHARQISMMREEVDSANDALDDLVATQSRAGDESRGAAASTGEQEAALRDLQGAVSSLIPGFGEMREKVSQVGAAWKASAAAGTSFGSRLGALAGGPIGLVTSAIAGLVAVFVSYKQKIDEVKAASDAAVDSANDYLDSLNEQASAAESAASEESALADELDRVTKAQNEANEAFKIAAERAEAVAAAEDRAAKARIDSQVASGDISQEEGTAQKAEIKAAAMAREVELNVELAQAAQERANAEVAAAKEVEAAAKAAADAAAANVDQVKADTSRPVVAAREKVLAAGAIADLSIFDPEANTKALDLAGGEEAVRDMIAEMDGLTGTLSRWRLSMGESAESILGGTGERAAIAAQLAEQGAIEGKAAEKASKSAVEAAKKKAEARAAELAAIQKAREAAEEEAEEAAAGVDAATFEEEIVKRTDIPIVQGEAKSARAEEAARLARERAAAAAKEEEERAATAQDSGAAVDSQAISIAEDAQALLSQAQPGQGNNALVQALQAIREGLADGTNEAELAALAGDLTAAMGEVVVKSTAVNSDLQQVRADLATLRSQVANNR